MNSEIKIDTHFAITALGKVSSGKSTFLNNLIGESYFKTGKSTSEESITEKVQIKENHWFGDKSQPLVTCIDTPGLLDDEKISKLGGVNHISQNLHTLVKEGFKKVFNVL
jgi:GTPase SAR1 family protein